MAVDRVSFEVPAATVFGLLGANGAGKSTTMRMLATLTRPTSGTARVCGHDVVRAPREVRRRLGYLSATSGLPSRLTCREVLGLFASLHEVDAVGPAVDAAIDTFGISEFADRRIETLSTGMRQRVRIATATVHTPAVLILDEPTAGLDVVASERLLEAIVEARERGTTVIFSTHILREAEKICDTICVIDEGRIRTTGTVAAICETTGQATFEEAFLALIAR